MKVYQCNTHELKGGAAIAAFRLNRALNQAGVESAMLATADVRGPVDPGTHLLQIRKSIPEVFFRRMRLTQCRKLDRSITAIPNEFDGFSHDLSPYGYALEKASHEVDILHLHWVSGMLDFPYLFSKTVTRKPIVWTLHDFNPMTGGCHYPYDCRGFHQSCGRCPQLASENPSDLSHRVFERKRRVLEQNPPNLTIITPSRWLGEQVKQSGLFSTFPLKVVPNALDCNVFKPGDRAKARDKLNLPRDAKIVLFGAANLDNKRKGIGFILDAARQLKSRIPEIYFVVAGHLKNQIPPDLPMVTLGNINDEHSMAEVYTLADVVVISSLQDNLPNILLESIACGVPVAGFSTGGIPEVIEDGVTGLLTADLTAEGLSKTIETLLYQVAQNPDSWRSRCREHALKHFGLEVQARRMKKIYADLLGKN